MPSNQFVRSALEAPPRIRLPAVTTDLDPSSARATQTRRISVLMGEIYEGAPDTLRARLLEHLLRPVSPYALIGIPGTGGVFAQIRARNAEWQGFRVEPLDTAT